MNIPWNPEIPREVVAAMSVCQRLGNPYQSVIIDTPEVRNEPRHDPLHLLD